MIAYAFRFPYDEKTQWIGLAVARNKREMFWQIDVHGDPYNVLVATVDRTSFCVKVTEDRYIDEAGHEDIDVDYEDVELSCDLQLWEDLKWRKPDWSGVHPTAAKREEQPA